MTSTEEPSPGLADPDLADPGLADPGLADPESIFVEVKLDGEPKDSKTDTEAKNGRMSGFFRKCCLCFDSITTSKNPLPENPRVCQRIRYAFLCPPHGIIGSYITAVFIFAILYGCLWSLFGEYAMPFNTIFEVWLHFVTSITGGYIIQLISLPPLLGMLIMGIVVHLFPHKSIDPTLSFVLRNTALTVILIRAGLGLDPEALKKLSFAVVRLAFSPCLVEAITAAIFSYLLLDLPIIWGLMLGFVIAAVSPAVVMPCLLHFQELGYGVDKGIPTLLIAAASIDDVLAITGFGVVIGIAFADGNVVWACFKGPLEALLGILLGAIIGMMLWYIPAIKQEKRIFLKGFILFAVGLMGILGCPRLEIPGTGPLLCLTVAFVAAVGWRRENEQKCLTLIMKSMEMLWFIFQPLLFSLIGAQMDIHKLSTKSITYGIATLLISLCIRSCVAFSVVFGTNMVLKEKFFVAIAWIPKATVQAAIGSLALSTAREKHKPEFEEYGLIILEVAVLAILITAPLGAVLVVVTGPRLLHRTDPNTLGRKKSQQEGQMEMETETGSMKMSL